MLRVLHICAASYSICPWNAWIFVIIPISFKMMTCSVIITTADFCRSLVIARYAECNWQQKWSMHPCFQVFSISFLVHQFLICPFFHTLCKCNYSRFSQIRYCPCSDDITRYITPSGTVIFFQKHLLWRGSMY